MITKAIEKINTEMQKNPNDKYTEIIGQYIIDRCRDEITAAHIMDEKKSLHGVMDAIRQQASKKKQGNVAVMTPQEVFGAVDTYFGLVTDGRAQQTAIGAACGYGQPIEPPVEKKVSLDLSDFL